MSAGRVLAAAAALTAAGVGAALLERRRRGFVRRLTATIPGAHLYWREQGRERPDALLYVALGDSAALGIGASTPANGYVGIVAAAIAERSGRPVRVRNLSIDGATLAVCIRDELPRLVPLRPDVCTLAIGANDVWTFEPTRFRAELETILAAVPAGTVVAELPDFSVLPVRRRVAAANAIIREAVAAHGMVLAPLNSETARGGLPARLLGSAGDRFHPNDAGYRRWAAAFLPAVRAAVDRMPHEPR